MFVTSQPSSFSIHYLLVLVSWLIATVTSFVVPILPALPRLDSRNNNDIISTVNQYNGNNLQRIFSMPEGGGGGSGGNGEGNSSSSNSSDGLDSLRKMLESSWNVETMGKIPSDSVESAEEAVLAIQNARENGINVFFVDLLLPSYDIKQGTNFYDEVLAVEYCIEIAKRLRTTKNINGKSSILVRNANTLDSVSRVINSREKEKMRQLEGLISETDQNDNKKVGQDQDQIDASNENDIDIDDDLTLDEDLSSDTDLDDFRKQLMASWNAKPSDPSTYDDDISKKGENESPPAIPPEKAPVGVNVDVKITPQSKDEKKSYRLASLFGNSKISNGADMMQDVVNAVRLNALPQDDEENIIILSAVSREEMVAARALVEKYEGQKNIILVNCKLDPIPHELRRGETVYSILPLIAKPEKGSGQTTTTTKSASSSPPPPAATPKIVVMRRYPNDWEIFVDIGDGFQLAERAPVFNRRIVRGPSMDWISESVQRYLRRNA